jgi:hypothetical protein
MLYEKEKMLRDPTFALLDSEATLLKKDTLQSEWAVVGIHTSDCNAIDENRKELSNDG